MTLYQEPACAKGYNETAEDDPKRKDFFHRAIGIRPGLLRPVVGESIMNEMRTKADPQAAR